MSKSGSESKQRKKRRKKKKKATADAPADDGPSTVKKSIRTSGGGGVLQSMRSGFKRAAGAGDDRPEDKPSTLSNIIWTILLLAAVGLLIYRFYG